MTTHSPDAEPGTDEAAGYVDELRLFVRHKKAEPMSIRVVIWTIVAFYDYDRRMKLKAARAAQGQKYVEESERRQAIAKQKRKCRKSIAYLNYRTQIRSGSFKLNAPDAPQDPCKKYKVPPIQECFFSDE